MSMLVKTSKDFKIIHSRKKSYHPGHTSKFSGMELTFKSLTSTQEKSHVSNTEFERISCNMNKAPYK